MSLSRYVFAAAACVALSASCTGESILVAWDEDGGDAASDAGPSGEPDASEASVQPDASGTAEPDAGSAGETCRDNADCPATAFCSKVRCGDPRGVCEDQPPFCNATSDPFCGCDGVNYFNDCLRRVHRVAAATRGFCGRFARRCSSLPGKQCDEPATCALIRGTCQPPDIEGECWVVPVDCQTGAGGDRFRPCEPAPTGEKACVNACEAISSGRQHVRVDHCRDGSGPSFGM